MNSGLAILVSFVFFIELLVAIRIFRNRRKAQKSEISQNQPVIIVLNQTSPSTNRSANTRGAAIQPNQILQKIISSPAHLLKKGKPSRFQQGLCLGSIFLITYLVILCLLEPFRFFEVLIFLPIFLVVPFLVIPSLFNLKSFTTFCCLVCGLGLGAFMLFLLS